MRLYIIQKEQEKEFLHNTSSYEIDLDGLSLSITFLYKLLLLLIDHLDITGSYIVF